MISYKTPQADLESKKGLFFEIGLIISLLIIFFIFQIKRPNQVRDLDFNRSELKVIQEEMIQTTQPKPPPPPAKTPMRQITLLTVVDDEQEAEADLEIQAEVSQTTVIPEYVPIERPPQEETIIEPEIFLIVEEQPEFPGGDVARVHYFSNQIKYPEQAKENGIQGIVYIGFVVEPDGSISNVSVLRGIGGGCDEEAVRVVKQMPAWKPGKQRNIPVRVRFTLPVRFTLL